MVSCLKRNPFNVFILFNSTNICFTFIISFLETKIQGPFIVHELECMIHIKLHIFFLVFIVNSIKLGDNRKNATRDFYKLCRSLRLINRFSVNAPRAEILNVLVSMLSIDFLQLLHE